MYEVKGLYVVGRIGNLGLFGALLQPPAPEKKKEKKKRETF